MVWYSHLFRNFAQFIVIHTVKHISYKGLSMTRKEVKELGRGTTEQCPFCSSNMGWIPGGHMPGKDGWR